MEDAFRDAGVVLISKSGGDRDDRPGSGEDYRAFIARELYHAEVVYKFLDAVSSRCTATASTPGRRAGHPS